MRRIAVIPARGGSKRIPRKNLKLFHGLPIIAYSILAARHSGLFDRIVVSTDDAEIAELVQGFGAEVPFMRPAHLADDHTGTIAVIQHAASTLRDAGESADYLCCLYATAPFIQPNHLQAGLAVLSAHPGHDYAFAITTFPFPVQRAIRLNAEGGVEALYPQYRDTRSQDLDEAYHDAGQFYWGRANAWLSAAPVFSPKSLPVVLPRYLVQDIDTLEDWQRAEVMYQVLGEQGVLVPPKV